MRISPMLMMASSMHIWLSLFLTLKETREPGPGGYGILTLFNNVVLSLVLLLTTLRYADFKQAI